MPPYLHGPDGEPLNAETFRLEEYLGAIPMLEAALASRAGRIELTRDDPLLWGLVYVPHLLKNADGEITFGDVHLGLYRDALAMREPAGIDGDRRAYVAPRGSGKSTSLFVITVLWLACHHPCFVAAFSDTSTQAEDHLKAVKTELQGNRLLRGDYPDACRPARKPNGMAISDSGAMYFSANGFSFSARGIDTGVLGLVDPLNRRPQVLLLDDVEGAEGSGYSLFQAGQRRETIISGVLPMNDRAHVRMVGTVTIVGGLNHELVNSVTTNDPPAPWITEERFTVTYFPPIPLRPDGTERSLWPGRWPLDHLLSIRHTRSFKKNFANQPAGVEGGYWQDGDIRYGTVPALTRRLLVVDPATTAKRTSDRTGIAVVAFSPTAGKCVVEHAEGVHLTGRRLAAHLAHILRTYPHRIHAVMVETNQGGDLWPEVFGDLPARVITYWSSLGKDERFATALDWYQRPDPLVVHSHEIVPLEAEMYGFPRYATDDIADAVVAGCERFLAPPKRTRVGARVTTYA